MHHGGRGSSPLPLRASTPLFRLGPFGDADDADGDPAAGVAGGLAEVIGLLVDDDAAAEDRGRAAEAEGGVHQVEGGVPLAVGLEVAEVADVTLGGVGGAVLHLVGVEVAAGGHAVGGGVVAELV